ncbi:YSIRK-type signal peptide-containing protein [Staphylococcus aureus]|nr:YSIRK-type signal peptide-containing protein [Staphylococcus aureus]
MLNRENKTAITRKGMVSNRLNKFSIRKYTVGTASILVGTTLIFGLGNQEAKAAESTNKELNEATTSASDNQSSDKVDMQQLNQEDNTKNDNQKERFFIFYGGKVKLPAFFNTQKAQLPL